MKQVLHLRRPDTGGETRWLCDSVTGSILDASHGFEILRGGKVCEFPVVGEAVEVEDVLGFTGATKYLVTHIDHVPDSAQSATPRRIFQVSRDTGLCDFLTAVGWLRDMKSKYPLRDVAIRPSQWPPNLALTLRVDPRLSDDRPHADALLELSIDATSALNTQPAPMPGVTVIIGGWNLVEVVSVY